MKKPEEKQANYGQNRRFLDMKKNNNVKPLDFMDFRAVFANKKLPARGGTDFLLSHTLGTRRRWWDDMAATGMYDDRKCSPRERRYQAIKG